VDTICLISPGVDILSHEASTVLHDEFSNDNVSNECRVLILCRMISVFLDKVHAKKSSKKPSHVDSSYKLLVPLMAAGLKSARELESMASDDSSTNKAKEGLLDILWEQICVSLARMFSPTPNGSKLLTIRHAVDLVDAVNSCSENASSRHSGELCAILSSGASKGLEVAKLFVDKGVEDKEIQRHRDESLKLFAACFTGVCQLQPQHNMLKIIAEQILSSALEVISKKTSDMDPLKDVGMQACLLICQAMQEINGVELVAIPIFPQLCQLVGAEETQLRKAVGGVLARVNVGKILEESQTKSEAAEVRARTAEKKVAELSGELEETRTEKEALQRQLPMI
jgi:hypothetical protein